MSENYHEFSINQEIAMRAWRTHQPASIEPSTSRRYGQLRDVLLGEGKIEVSLIGIEPWTCLRPMSPIKINKEVGDGNQ